MTEVSLCPICDGTAFIPFLHCKDHTVSHETFLLQKCTQCEFVVTSPSPDTSKLGDYYLSDSYISHNNKATSTIDKIYLIVRSYTLHWKIRIIKKYSTQSNRHILLDYGCGTGEFLKTSKAQGFEIFGVEPSEKGRTQSTIATGNTIYPSLDQVPQPEFDAITLWHVLEHIPDLNASLNEIKNKLSNSGTMFIAVPNHRSWDATHYNKRWAAYDVPRHLWHFSQDNMRRLLNKHSLRIVHKIPMKLDAFYVSLLSEKYLNDEHTNLNGMIHALLNGIKSNLAARKNLEYSSLIYIVRK